jgi:hypothetical protein
MPVQSDLSIDEVAALRKFDNIIWGFISVIAAIILLAPVVTDFQIVWRTFILNIIASVTLIAGSWYYFARRNELRLSSALGSTGQIMLFSAIGAPLSYLGASAGFPLWDHAFDTADKALCFNWMTLLAWLNSHPTTFGMFRAIYLSLSVQANLVVLSLAFTGRLAWLRVFVLAFICTAIMTIVISAFLPAQGVWSYYELTADSWSIIPTSHTSWPVFHGLRDGSYRQLVAAGAEGIITFPSLHAALAVILIAAIWPVPVLRWLIVPANLAMLAATPIDGSHYFIDVLAGIAVAALSLVTSYAVSRRTTAYSSPEGRKTLHPRTRGQRGLNLCATLDHTGEASRVMDRVR